MSKRKITQQQQRRIDERLTKVLDSPEQLGLVLAHHGHAMEVEDAHGQNISCSKRQNLGAVVVGDKVRWQMDIETNTGVVIAVEPRTTLLSRPDARGELHAVAANIDLMIIVIAPEPAPNQTTVDRYLIAAETLGITAIVVLNKEDLLPSTNQQQLLSFMQQYKEIGLATIILSAQKKQNIDTLQKLMHNKFSVFVGQSGVGKSSLIATLVPQHTIKTGELSQQNKQGKHTTTTARLYHFADQTGSIIDSPGIREFPLCHMPAAELARGFREFRPFLHECKFRNCLHLQEPSCALREALNAGKISQARLVSYQKILAEMQEQGKYHH